MAVSYEAAETLLSVRPADLDSLGHVNNARVLEYLEHGRWDWLRRNGFSSGVGIVPVVVSLEVHYLAQIRLEDIRVGTDLRIDPEAVYKARFGQSVCVVGAEQRLAVKATVSVAFVSARDQKVCTIEEYIASATCV
jgi:YbgC/YbaW family acyl-CoA thioester hydrolase